MATSILSKKTVCVITGPSKGLGRAISLQMCKMLPKGSLFILLSRNMDLLKELSSIIKECDGINAVYREFDQGHADGINNKNILESSLTEAGVSISDFEQALLVNNAGTLEPLEFTNNLDQLNVSTEFFKTNLAGCVTLTSSFLQVFGNLEARIIINISSLAAISPMKSWLLYCMAKAARDMMMKVVAAEEEKVRTLNYAPGPLYTDMYITASKDTKDPVLRKMFEDSLKDKTYVECDESALKLIKILRKNSFENAAHIDYYDDI